MIKHIRKTLLPLVTCIALFSSVFCTVVPVKASAADTSSEKTFDESKQNGWFTKIISHRVLCIIDIIRI